MRVARRVLNWLAPPLMAAVALLSAGPRGAVDWSAIRAVALESDDWGLAGFVPSITAWDGLPREALSPGTFPAVYWNSTLEDSAMVSGLAAVLGAHRGRDGLPAMLQPNYVMSSLAWEDGQWRRHDLPDLPSAYARPGLWPAVSAAVRQGVWYPEFHAAWHYDPQLRQEATAGSDVARAATARGIMLFPGSEDARELGPWRSTAMLAGEIDTALSVFTRAFGRRPGSLIAPDYTWDARVESLWSTRGLTVIQAKREQRDPGLPRGTVGRVIKVLERQWSRAAHPDRVYLERNCRLEPVQSPDANAIVAACVKDTERAWRRGQPAIVETHRVNFAHGEAAVVLSGQRGLDNYLRQVAALPGPRPLYLADVEIAALMRGGVSVRAGAGGLVVRNGTRARRVAVLPVVGSAPGAKRILILLDGGHNGVFTSPPAASDDRLNLLSRRHIAE